MTLAVSVTGIFIVFLIYVLLVAIRVDNAEAARAAWFGITIMVTVNVLAYLLYRSQSRVLDEAIGEMTDLFDTEVGQDGESGVGLGDRPDS